MDSVKQQIQDNILNTSEVMPQGEAAPSRRSVFRNATLCAALALGTCAAPVQAGWNGNNGNYSYDSGYQQQQRVYETSAEDMQQARQAYQSYYNFALNSEDNSPSSLKNAALLGYNNLIAQNNRQYQNSYNQQNPYQQTIQSDKTRLAEVALSRSSESINYYTAAVFAIAKLNDSARQMTGNPNYVHPVVEETLASMPTDIQPLARRSLYANNPNMSDANRIQWARDQVNHNGVWKQLMTDISIQEAQNNPAQYPSFVKGYAQPQYGQNQQNNCQGSFFNGICNQFNNAQNQGPNFRFNTNTRPTQDLGIVSDTARFIGNQF